MRGVGVVRPLLAAAAALLLAGCASEPPTSAPATPAPTLVQPEALVLAEGTYEWHTPQTGLFLPLTYYAMLSQAVANPCLYEDGVYFNNHQVATWRATGQLPLNGSLALTVDWEDADFAGTTLVAAYKAPGQDGYTETARIPRGATHAEPIVADPNAANADWDLWLCINDEASRPGDPGWQTTPFLGSVQVKAAFTPDPLLDTQLAALEAAATAPEP